MNPSMTRDELERRLIAALGADLAGALMAEIRPADLDWSQVATKQDLRDLRDELKAELASKEDLARFATKDDLTRFATKDDLTRFATKDDLLAFPTREELHAELRATEQRILDRVDDRIARSQSEMIAAMHEAISTAVVGQTRTMLFTLLGTALSFAAIMFTAVQVT